MTSEVSYAQVDDRIQAIIDRSPVKGSTWSLTVANESGTVHESLNSDQLIAPASNQKLYTTAAILAGLGPDFTFKTKIYGEGKLVDGVWQGNLIIKGSGDPSISGFLYDDDREYVFKSFLEQMREKGIRSIDGELRADISYFDNEMYPKGWDWDDLSFYYGVEINPLSFNNNAFDLEVWADGDVGDKPRIDWYPKIESIHIDNNQEIVEPNLKYDEYYRRKLGYNRYVLASKLPQGYKEEESLSINHANAFFLEAFERFLLDNEFELSEQLSYTETTEGDEDIQYTLLAEHESKPLRELIECTNKESDNFYTEMLLKTLAAEKSGLPGTFDAGILEVRSFLSTLGIDTTFVRMKDGSGLASGNLTTTNNLSSLLIGVQGSDYFDDFYRSLSIAGIDGTLQHRFKGTSLYNNIRGKSGFKGGVRTLTGYMESASGERLIFSIATNHFVDKVSVVDRTHQQILELIHEKY